MERSRRQIPKKEERLEVIRRQENERREKRRSELQQKKKQRMETNKAYAREQRRKSKPRLTAEQKRTLRTVPLFVYDTVTDTIVPDVLKINILGLFDVNIQYKFVKEEALATEITGFYNQTIKNPTLSMIGFNSIHSSVPINGGIARSLQMPAHLSPFSVLQSNPINENALYYVRTVPSVTELSRPIRKMLNSPNPVLGRIFYLLVFKNIGDSSTVVHALNINSNPSQVVIKPPDLNISKMISDVFLKGVGQARGAPLSTVTTDFMQLAAKIRQEIGGNNQQFYFDSVVVGTPDRLVVIECILRGVPFIYRTSAGTYIVRTPEDAETIKQHVIANIESLPFKEGIKDIFRTAAASGGMQLALNKRQLLDGAHDFGDGGKPKARSMITIQEYINIMNDVLTRFQGTTQELIKFLNSGAVMEYDSEQKRVPVVLNELFKLKTLPIIFIPFRQMAKNKNADDIQAANYLNPPGANKRIGILQDAMFFLTSQLKKLKLKGISRGVNSSSETHPTGVNTAEFLSP